MLEAVRTCFRKYVTFSGRARRPEYWWFVLFYVIAGAFAAGLDGLVFGPSVVVVEGGVEGAAVETSYGGGPFATVVSLGTFLPLLAVGWRRMHDTGRPGWLYLLPTLVALGGGVIAAAAGLAGSDGGAAVLVLVALLGGLAAFLLLIYWLTRPSEPGANAYGPEPA